MERRIFWTRLSLAAAAALMLSASSHAQCDSGSCDSGGFTTGAVVAGNYGGRGCGLGRGCNGCNFGYPGTDCCSNGSCGIGGGGHTGPLRQHSQHLWQIHQRDFARNQAWPRPFDCADRQLYHEIWNPMLETGSRWNCVFTAQHFDPDTNELNNVGQAKVKAIFRNFAMNDKYALVQNEGNQTVVDSRLENLRSTIDKWYGTDTFVEIASADLFPGKFAGARAENLNTMYGEQAAPPIIPVASGTGSTSDVGVGQ